MSFSKAPIRRFNEMQSHSPPVGSYDPKFEGTIPNPYPKGDSAFPMRCESWRGSTQSLLSMASGRLSSRSSCYSVTSEKVAMRLHSSGCLGMTPLLGRRHGRVWSGGMAGVGTESGRYGWAGSMSARAVSEVNVKSGIAKVIDTDRGGRGWRKEKLKVKETKAQDGKCKVNVEDKFLKAKRKIRGMVVPEIIASRLSGRQKTEVSGKVKCKEGRESSGKAVSPEVDGKAHCQATGETFIFHKGLPKHALSKSRALEYVNNHLETAAAAVAAAEEPLEEWQSGERTAFGRSNRLRMESRKLEFTRPRKKENALRHIRENWLKKHATTSESNPEQSKRGSECLPVGNNSELMVDVDERVSRAEDEAELLRSRVDELERENAELEQARALTERDLSDEVDWRTEELEKTEAHVEKIRASKRRYKQDLKQIQADLEDLRVENLRITSELEGSRASATVLRSGARRSAEELERALQLVENLRLENSRKVEELENSQLLARHLRTEYVTASDKLEKSESLVEDLSAEMMTKITELERSLAVVRNLQAENGGKTAALEKSWKVIADLQMENQLCRETIRNCKSYVGNRPAGDVRNTNLRPWSRQGSTFNPGSHATKPMLQTKPRRTAIDEDCEMTEELQVEKNLNNSRSAIGVDIPGSNFRSGHEVGIQSSWDVTQTGFRLAEDRRLLSELPGVCWSRSKVPESLGDANGGRQLRGSQSLCDSSESFEENRQQKVSAVRSEPILTDDLMAICNQIQILSLRRPEEGTSLETEGKVSGNQEETHGNPMLSRESENLNKCAEKENPVCMELESLRKRQGTFISAAPGYMEELHRTLENLRLQIPKDTELNALRETSKDVERTRDSNEFPESLNPESGQIEIDEKSDHSTSYIHNNQSDHTDLLNRPPEEDTANDHDEGHRHPICDYQIAGKVAGDRRAVENFSSEKTCMNAVSHQLKFFERNAYCRSTTIINKSRNELNGSATEDGGLYKLIGVYDERLDNYRERFNPITNEQRQREMKLLKQTICRHRHAEKVGENCVRNGGEKFGDSYREKTGKEFPGETCEIDAEGKQHREAKLGGRSAGKFGEKFDSDFEVEKNFGDKLGDGERSVDSVRVNCDPAVQWRRRYEQLWSVAEPFKELLSAFSSQRQLLQGRRNAGKAEIEKLSHEFTKILNHEHERQRMGQIVQLRDQNSTLRKELDMLRTKADVADVTRR